MRRIPKEPAIDRRSTSAKYYKCPQSVFQGGRRGLFPFVKLDFTLFLLYQRVRPEMDWIRLNCFWEVTWFKWIKLKCPQAQDRRPSYLKIKLKINTVRKRDLICESLCVFSTEKQISFRGRSAVWPFHCDYLFLLKTIQFEFFSENNNVKYLNFSLCQRVLTVLNYFLRYIDLSKIL